MLKKWFEDFFYLIVEVLNENIIFYHCPDYIPTLIDD